jgi:2-C-methyl-D-erythritol 4-phosphate cytidylyltransferase
VKVALVIPAAGSGERLGMGVPKALVELDGIPLLVRTLDRLASAMTFLETVILAPPAEVARFADVVAGSPAPLGLVRVLPGGATRQGSVAAGVAALGEEADVVAVHDAARPLVARETVRAVVAAARDFGAATVASRPIDSVRSEVEGGGSFALDRSKLWLVETPQAFRRELLRAAHAAAARSGREFTDDASVVEASGHSIHVVASAGPNPKITHACDLVLAGEILRNEPRTDGSRES